MLILDHYRNGQQWVREHHSWAIEQWKKMAWSDLTHFLAPHVDRKVHVCHISGEEMALWEEGKPMEAV